MKTVERFEDMSPRGRLRIWQQDDADIIVEILPDPDKFEQRGGGYGESVEFCFGLGGGGKSPRTHAALVALMQAMADDNADPRSSGRKGERQQGIDGQAAQPCPAGECQNRAQCWEPCGDLGKSEEHARRVIELKTDPQVFDDVAAGRKPFEIRFDDRGYKVGDVLHLRRTRHTGAEMKAGAPLEYTGESLQRQVGYILRGPVYGLAEGWAILAFAPTRTLTARELATAQGLAHG